MKKRRIIVVLLAGIMAFTAFCCAFAAESGQNSAADDVSATTEEEAGATLSLEFVDYEDGIVDGYDTAVLEEVKKDAKRALKITPNLSSIYSDKYITVDGYSYQEAGIDLSVFRWGAIEYYYESPNPVDDNMYFAILKLGGVLNSDSVISYSSEKLVSGVWTVAFFDFSELETKLNWDNSSYNAQQLHIRPFANTKLQNLTTDDVFYISRIMFFEDEPNFTSHNAYMQGYEDGTFRPSGTVTRAEACTIAARLLEDDDVINGSCDFSDVPENEWYAKYIGFCRERGLLPSYSGEFLPDEPITRAQFMELLYLAELSRENTELPEEYEELDGIYSIRSNQPITRAEAAAVTNRALGRTVSTKELTDDLYVIFLDVDHTHWAFADIAEATVPHVASNGSWGYILEDPISKLAEKIGMGAIYNFDKTNAKLAELDSLEEERIRNIRNTPNMDLSRITGRKIYVSESSGKDTNSGLTEAKPVKTAAMANTLARSGDVILFKRGDLWREQFSAKAGVTYTAYGEGEKPKFYGSPENGADASKWTPVYENTNTGARIWKYENENMLDVGTLVFNEGEGYAMKEIPSSNGNNFIVRGTNTPFNYTTELDKNFEFFQAANSVYSDVINANNATGPLYLRCDNGNPGEVFDSIEFIARGPVITVGGNSNVTIDNLCLKYSAFGISALPQSNLKITNMEIGWIGGNIQYYAATTGAATRYGNGIEVYGSCDGYTVDNCYIYQCYDAGVTHQITGGDGTTVHQNNVTYSNNVITDCVYSIEYFLGIDETTAQYERCGENILFEGNLMRRAGFGFGSFRPDINNQRHIRSGKSGNNFKNFVIRDNIFDRAVYELVQTNINKIFANDETAIVYDGNIYIQGVNNGLFSHAVEEGARTNLAAAKAIKEILGDENAEVYFTEYIPNYTFTYELE